MAGELLEGNSICIDSFSFPTPDIWPNLLFMVISDVMLTTMQRRIRGESRKAVKKLRRLIKEYRQAPDNEEHFYLIYTEMQRVIQEVKELQKELNLE